MLMLLGVPAILIIVYVYTCSHKQFKVENLQRPGGVSMPERQVEDIPAC